MLVLSRKRDEQIIVGDNIKIKVLQIRGNTVRIGIEAPGEVSVMRGELVKQEAPRTDEQSLTVEFKNKHLDSMAQSPRLRVIGENSPSESEPVSKPPVAAPKLDSHRLRAITAKITEQE